MYCPLAALLENKMYLYCRCGSLQYIMVIMTVSIPYISLENNTLFNMYRPRIELFCFFTTFTIISYRWLISDICAKKHVDC